MCLFDIVSNGRCEGANPSSHVTALPNPEFPNHFRRPVMLFKLGISIPNLRTCATDDRSHLYRKDRWQLLFILMVIQVVAGNRYDNEFLKETDNW